MKIKVESEKIVKAVKKLDGIEIVVDNADDAKEALKLILRKSGLFQRDDYREVMELNVTASQHYETSAVDYKLILILEFIFKDQMDMETRVSMIKELQEFFRKV